MLINVRPPPFSPWLRLAHIVHWPLGANTGTGTRRRLKDWKFLLQLTGVSWLWYADAVDGQPGRWPLHPGDLALVPPGCEYAWGIPNGSHLAVHFDLHAQPSLNAQAMVDYIGGPVDTRPLRECPRLRLQLGSDEHDCLAVVRTGSARRWCERLQPLVQQWSRHDHARPAARLAAAGILSAAVADWLAQATVTPSRRAPAELAVAAMLDRLATRPPSRDLDLSALARETGLGETSLRRAMRALTGMTPRAWLEHRRVEHAIGLLRDGRSTVSVAAAAVGYPDPFHFARVFRRVVGHSPSHWQRQQPAE